MVGFSYVGAVAALTMPSDHPYNRKQRMRILIMIDGTSAANHPQRLLNQPILLFNFRYAIWTRLGFARFAFRGG